MSSNQNYKQVANVVRRRWDIEAYEKKAAARKQRELEELDGKVGDNNNNNEIDEKRALGKNNISHDDEKEEFRPAVAGAAGPEGSQRAFLKARKGKVEGIDDQVGSSVMLSVEEATASSSSTATTDANTGGVKKSGIGWHCTVCDCYLKDSHTYLDHINGRKHQRKLGYSMRVERTTEDDLMNKLNQLQKQSEQKDQEKEYPIDYNDLVKQKDEEEKRKKEERQKKRKERKRLQKEKEREEKEKQQQQQQQSEEAEQDDDEEEEDGGINPDMAAMMGFSGFGGGNKNH